MKNRTLIKDIFREIKKTKNRFLSIFAIIALGTGFFSGIKITCPDMKLTAEEYYDQNNLMDVSFLSTFGFTQEDVTALAQQDGIEEVMPGYSYDVIVNAGSEQEVLTKVLSIGDNTLNQPQLIEGRLPENSGECVVESGTHTPDNFQIGETITLTSGVENEAVTDTLKTDTYKIVGIVRSPLYINFERGSTSIGNGSLDCFILVPETDFTLDAYTDLYATLSSAKELNSFEDDYQKLVDEKLTELEKFGKERAQIRKEEIYEDSNAEIQSSIDELNEAKELQQSELQKALDRLNDGEQQLSDAKAELNQRETQLEQETSNALAQLQAATQELKNSQQTLQNRINSFQTLMQEGENKLSSGQKEIEESQAKLDEEKQKAEESRAQVQASIDEGYRKYQELVDYYTSTGELEEKQEELAQMKAQLDESQTKLNNTYQEGLEKFAAAQQTIDASKQELEQSRQELERQRATALAQFDEAQKKIDSGYQEVEQNTKTLEEETASAQAQISSAWAQINQQEQELQDGRAEYEQQKAESEKQIADGENQIREAQRKLNELESPTWYVFDRSTNPGYSDYGNDAERVDNVAKVFPVFFILVAILVCLTTMTRMVEEHRIQIGTLKALGYSKGAIVSKYIVYASLASLLGSIVGVLLCSKLFPIIIFNAYRIMYNLPDIIAPIRWNYLLLSILVSIVCTVSSAFLSCYAELFSQPAQLMRPKAPKAGKQILLEKIPFLWSKFSFIYKVTFRNIFRYKKRILMTVIGIAGCTALMLTGFGLRHAISSIVPKQFEEIFRYDAIAALEDDLSAEEKESLYQELSANTMMENEMFLHNEALEVSANDVTKSATLYVPEDTENFSDYIVLRERKGHKPLNLEDDGIIISEKLAKLLSVKTGDQVSLVVDNESLEVIVSGITENYTTHMVYMSPRLYESLYQESPDYNCLIFHLADDVDSDTLSTQLNNDSRILGISFSDSISSSFEDIVSSLNYIVLIIIVCAGALAFIVLYNLININVTERTRELATIKVLGFFDREVDAYIYRETVFCTLLGIIAGLILGIFLERFVVVTAEVDVVMFTPEIDVMSYLLSAFLTLLFTVIVIFALHFKLKKLDMVESLKELE